MSNICTLNHVSSNLDTDTDRTYEHQDTVNTKAVE